MSDEVVFGGHSTVLIELGETRLVTDPLLRRHVLGWLRRHHRPERGAMEDVDAVLISHLHHDHADLPSLRRLGRSKPIIGPPGAGEFLRGRGFTDVSELAPGEQTTVGGVTVRAVKALHSGGRMYGRGPGTCVGYVIEGGPRIYFAGDTDLFPEMAAIGPGIDLALLPIWGWGSKLGEGHLDPESAAEAAALIKPRAVVPIHWGSIGPPGAKLLWPWLFERPAREFGEAMTKTAPDVDVRVLEPGGRLDLAEVAG